MNYGFDGHNNNAFLCANDVKNHISAFPYNPRACFSLDQ